MQDAEEGKEIPPQFAGAAHEPQSTSPAQEGVGDKHKLTLLQAVGLNTMNMFGTGPLITIPYCLASVTPQGPQCLYGYSLAAVACMLDSLVWAELGSLWPESGGTYVYLRECYGPQTWGRLMAFVFVWQFIVSGPAEIAAGYIAMVEYGAVFTPQGISYVTRVGVSISLAMLTLILLYRKTNEAGRIGLVLWAITIAVIIFTIVVAFSSFDGDNVEQPLPAANQFVWSMAAATRFGIFDMTGYYDVNSMGDEVQNPRRTIPLAGISTAYVVGVAFVLIYVSVVGMQPFERYIDMFTEGYKGVPQGIMSIVIQTRFGSAACTGVVTIFVIITIFGSTFAQMCGYSYIPYAAARDGCFFSFLSHEHPKHHGLKDYSLVLIGAVSAMWCCFSIDQVIDAMTTLLVMMQFVGQSVGLLLYRRRHPEAGGWRMPFYPWPCILQIVIFTFIFLTSRSRLLYGSKEPTLELAVCVLAAGTGFFLLRSKREGSWPFAKEIGACQVEDGGSSTSKAKKVPKHEQFSTGPACNVDDNNSHEEQWSDCRELALRDEELLTRRWTAKGITWLKNQDAWEQYGSPEEGAIVNFDEEWPRDVVADWVRHQILSEETDTPFPSSSEGSLDGVHKPSNPRRKKKSGKKFFECRWARRWVAFV